jgi:hypothetical protein
MNAGRYIWFVALISAALVLVVDGQENPLAGKAAAVEEGASLFSCELLAVSRAQRERWSPLTEVV